MGEWKPQLKLACSEGSKERLDVCLSERMILKGSGRCDGPGCGDAGWRMYGRFGGILFDEDGPACVVELGAIGAIVFFTLNQAPQKVTTPHHLAELPVAVVHTCYMFGMVKVQVDGVDVGSHQIQACCLRLVRLARLVVVHGHAQSPQILGCLVK